jgi:putative transposase
MPTQRRQFTAEFKAKVAVEAIRGVKTTSELAAAYGVHPVQISQWKRQALDGLGDVFGDKRKKAEDEQAATTAELYQQIGQLKVELDWMKKKAGLLRK